MLILQALSMLHFIQLITTYLLHIYVDKKHINFIILLFLIINSGQN